VCDAHAGAALTLPKVPLAQLSRGRIISVGTGATAPANAAQDGVPRQIDGYGAYSPVFWGSGCERTPPQLPTLADQRSATAVDKARGRQHQPGVGDQPPVIKPHVDFVGLMHRT
jgi:hypothetical protein